VPDGDAGMWPGRCGGGAGVSALVRAPIAERARLLLEIAEQIDANLDKLALAESTDGGKPLHRARTAEIPERRRTSLFRVRHRAIPLRGLCTISSLSTIRSASRAASRLLSPWNLRCIFSPGKSPRLATGNTVVAKPSELTPTLLIC